jgi:hypothetical protein
MLSKLTSVEERHSIEILKPEPRLYFVQSALVSGINDTIDMSNNGPDVCRTVGLQVFFNRGPVLPEIPGSPSE